MKLPLARPGIVDRLVKRILRQESKALPARPEDVLTAIFQQVFVQPSGQKGLLGNVEQLVITGDSTPVRTGLIPMVKRFATVNLRESITAGVRDATVTLKLHGVGILGCL